MRCSVGNTAAGAVVDGGILPSGLSGAGEGRVKIAFGGCRLGETRARAYAVNCKAVNRSRPDDPHP
ncbi:hypothetical protein CIK02_03845 [Pseudomonas putida]|nr:hypothetical protein DK184_07905 [Pseudomonas sp. RW405]RIZ46260.1 hypothetical protein CIK02_03845 [Pseudomonas putida]